MTRLVVLALLLLPILAVAAPVPKKKPAFGPFGDFTDPKTKCKAEFAKDGSLTITVPTEQPAVDAEEKKPLRPTIATSVEGDFSLTVRLNHSIPDGAGAATKDERTRATSGLAVFADGDTKTGAMAVFVRESNQRRCWTMQVWADQQPGSAAWSEFGTDIEPTEPVYLRVTRKGDEVRFEQSKDAKKWYYWRGSTLKGLTDRVTIGPVAFQSTDKEFTATFDEYELKPLVKEEKK